MSATNSKLCAQPDYVLQQALNATCRDHDPLMTPQRVRAHLS
ncbi:hypothetical protein [Massilia antarctica]|nr:hypothetical protein [Massilia antarctica]